MYRGLRVSPPSSRRRSATLRARELSVTAASPQTAFSSSSLPMSFPGLRSRASSTRNALGSTGNTSPALVSENSRSRTSTSSNLNTKDLFRSELSGVAEQGQQHAKCLGLDRQHLAGLGQRELPLPDFNVIESEYKGLIRHHDPIISSSIAWRK